MQKFKKSILLTSLMIAFCLALAQYAMATGNIIENFPSTMWLCSPDTLITYADIDEDPCTGVDVGGVWYPNETQIVLIPFEGDMGVNQPASPDQIFFSHIGANCVETGYETKRGRFAIRFIDATAPGWVWNDPNTWQERSIQEAELKITHDLCWNYLEYIGPDDPGNVSNPNPDVRATAYEHWGGVNQQDQLTADQFSNIQGSLTHPDGFSEIYVTTDFCENNVEYLYLWEKLVPPSPNTPEGNDVVVDIYSGVQYVGTLNFSMWWTGNASTEVTRAGNSDIFRQPSPPFQIPVNFKIEPCPGAAVPFEYQILTDALYSGPVGVLLRYDDTQCDENNLRLLHCEGDSGLGCAAGLGEWVDVTTGINTVDNIIYGLVWRLQQCAPPVYNTPEGSDVEVTIDNVTITFEEVTDSGDTTVIGGDTGPPIFTEYILDCDPPVFYEIETTATYSGTIEVCITYDDEVCDESDLHLLHYWEHPQAPSIAGWVDVTTSLDTVNNIICGSVTDLSPFVLGSPAICGDLDFDGDVDSSDRTIILNALRTCTTDDLFDVRADLDGDGCVTFLDYREWYICYKDFVSP